MIAQLTLWPHEAAAPTVAPLQPPLVYRSGMSARADFTGYAQAGVPVGVDIQRVSRPVADLIVAYNGTGGRVFVDSGAFGAYRRGGRVAFAEVLARYEALLGRAANKGALALVMPDLVGDQQGTLAELKRYRVEVRQFITAGADVIVPLQKGAHALAAFYHVVVAALGTNNFRVGLPARAAAVTEAELLTFVAEVAPRRLHLLGIARSKRFAPLVARIGELAPATHVSADANHLRALVGVGRPLTIAVEIEVRERAAAAAFGGDMERGWPDETEFVAGLYNTPFFLTAAQARIFAAATTEVAGLRAGIVRAATTDVVGVEFGSALGDLLEREFPGHYGEMVVWQGYYALVKRAVGAEVRAAEITRIAGARHQPARQQAAGVERAVLALAA